MHLKFESIYIDYNYISVESIRVFLWITSIDIVKKKY